jgi:hypothetical protein
VIRAEEHLAAVRAEVDFWREGDICTLGGEFKSDTQYAITMQERIAPPIRLSVLIGEVAACLRSALDHQVFALVERFDSERAADPDRARWISFPIFESTTTTSRSGKEKPISFGSLSGIPELIQTIIKGNQPYDRGDDAPRHPLAVVNRLANTDKHRTLLLTSAYFTKGGHFGLSTPHNPMLRQSMVVGAFKPGTELIAFDLTSQDLATAGCKSPEDVQVYGYAAAGVAFGEPEMDTTREVPEILEECVAFVRRLVALIASRSGIV